MLTWLMVFSSSSRDRRRRRSRSRSGDRRRRDSRRDRRRSKSSSSRSRSPSPRRVSASNRSNKPKPMAPPNKVWDGFQWVDRIAVVAPSAIAQVVSSINSTGTASGIGSQKDRRIYVGNLPPGVNEEIIKSFCECTSVTIA